MDRANRLNTTGAVVITALLLVAPASASAATMTLDGGKPAVDRSGVIEAAEWSIPDEGGTVTRTDTDGNYTAAYSFPLPTSIPAEGATVAVSVTATANKNSADQHTRFVPAMSVSGDIVGPDGNVVLSSDADTTVNPSPPAATANVTLTPRAGQAVVTVGIQDGPVYTYTYTASADAPSADGPCSVTQRLQPSAAANGCRLGALPIGQSVSIAAPAAGTAANISPARLPPDTAQLILEIVLEQEAERTAAALAAKFKENPGAEELFQGCLFFTDTVIGDENNTQVSGANLIKACEQLVLRQPAAIPAANVAANGCRAAFVPFFPSGTRVTRKRRNRAVAAARRQFRTSCRRNTAGGMSLSLKARRRKATLNRLLGRRVRTSVALSTPSGTTPSQRMGVRWQANKRRR